MYKQIKFNNYNLNYYYKPAEFMSNSDIDSLMNKLKTINKDCGINFNYGIFDESKKNYFLNNTIICVIEYNDYPIGFFYNVIIDYSQRKIVHQGLVILSKNPESTNLMYFPYLFSNIILRENIGDFYITSISNVPSIIGHISNFKNVWPAHNGNMIKPPSKDYVKIAEIVFNEYVKKNFPDKNLSFDKKRFVIKSDSVEMGFNNKIRNLPRHEDLRVNLFCFFWLDYEKNEDLIQVGEFDSSIEERELTEYENTKLSR